MKNGDVTSESWTSYPTAVGFTAQLFRLNHHLSPATRWWVRRGFCSIRKAGDPEPPIVVPDDVQARLEEAQVALRRLADAVRDADEAKGVFVYDDDGYFAMSRAVGEANEAVNRALDHLAGRGKDEGGAG